jgi:hypothetical protein
MRSNTNTRSRRATPGLIVLGVTCTVAAGSSSQARAEEPVLPVIAPLAEPAIGAPASRPRSRRHVVLSFEKRNLNLLEGHALQISGVLRPRLAKRVVTLQVRREHGWATLARTVTGVRGHFTIRYRALRAGSKRLRLRFAGDAEDLPADRYPGRLNVYAMTQARSSSTRSFVRCVTMHESSMNWHIEDPPYSGGDQWTQSTWLEAGGGRFAPIAAEATPDEQMWVFDRYEPSHPGAWPVSVPACS